MLLPAPPPAPPQDSTSPTTSAGRAINLMVELVEIGRAIELCPEPWAWPLAQRTFKAKADLGRLVGEAIR